MIIIQFCCQLLTTIGCESRHLSAKLESWEPASELENSDRPLQNDARHLWITLIL